MSKALGEIITNIRILRGLEQQQLAQQADITPSYLCHIEKGNRTPSVKILKHLSEILDFPFKELLIAAKILTPQDIRKATKPIQATQTEDELISAVNEILSLLEK